MRRLSRILQISLKQIKIDQSASFPKVFPGQCRAAVYGVAGGVLQNQLTNGAAPKLHSLPQLLSRLWGQRRQPSFKGFGNVVKIMQWSFCRYRNVPRIPETTALYGLIAANVSVFLLWRGDTHFMTRHFTTSWDAIKAGRLHTLTLAAFSQRNTIHLLSNMLGLYFFGRGFQATQKRLDAPHLKVDSLLALIIWILSRFLPIATFCRNVAWRLGGKGLVLLYLACGTFGSLLYVAMQGLQERQLAKHKLLDGFHLRHTPSLGSSGAVNGIVIFEILMMPFATILIYGVLPLPAWVLGALFLAQDINGAIGRGRSNVGYTAHLGGAAVGAAAFLGVRFGKIPMRWR